MSAAAMPLGTSRTVYPSPIKRRRATKAQMRDRHQALLNIVKAGRPMTVRQVFYAATVRGLIEKTERGYQKVAESLTALRRSGAMPYEWLADSTRWMRKPTTYGSLDDALKRTVETYRKDLWADSDAYVEIWLEKDALAGVVYPVTEEYDVPLMVARGYSSLSFLASAARAMEQRGQHCYVYHLGDHDPSGVNAGENIEHRLRELAPSASIIFERVAVTQAQIAEWKLPSRPTKTSDPRSGKWRGGDSVELDALSTERLQGLVRGCIEQHLPAYELARLKKIEEAERETLERITGLATRAIRMRGAS